jgi:FtsH-binding integral membrane protein
MENVLTYKSASELNTAMGRVYANMGLAVLTSMIVSMLVSSSPGLMALLFGTALKWVIIFAPLVAVFAISFALSRNPSKPAALAMLHGFAALMGLSFATIFVVYNLGSIISAFMGGAVLFGVAAGYGYFTKQNLDSIGKWLFVGLIGIVIASIINIFVGSSVAQMVISALAVVIFTGLTAYDAQNIRENLAVDDSVATEISGALNMYLNFINIFLSLLQLFGEKKD